MAAPNVIPFPGPTVPRQPSDETVWFSGGSLHVRYGAHVRDMPVEFALQRREFWARRCRQLGCDPTSEESRLAARRWGEITRALDALDTWNRGVGKPSPYAPEHVRQMFAASLEIEDALAARQLEQQP